MQRDMVMTRSLRLRPPALSLLLVCLPACMTATASAVPPKVYLDESRSLQLGIQTWFSPRCSRAMRLSRVTDLITLENLRKYDVIVVWNQIEDIAYSKEELAAVREFVSDGGGLLIIGTPGPHTRKRATFRGRTFPRPEALPRDEFALNAMSGVFGVLFSNASRNGSPDFTTSSVLAPLSTVREVTFKQPISCLVGNLDGKGVVARAFGHPVIVAASFGRGRVIVCGASRLFMKHGELADRKLHKHDTEIAAQEDLLLRWLEWLAAHSPIRTADSAKLPNRIPGRLCMRESALVVYTIPQLAHEAEELVADWRKVWPELSRITGLSSPVELVNGATPETPLTVYLCASTAGGLSAGDRIAVPAKGGSERLISVVSHEVGHKLLGGCNHSVSEGFAEWMAIKGLEAAGFQDRAAEKVREKLQAFRKEDPDGTALNIIDDLSDIRKSPACQGKWIWILMTLEKEHGDTFLRDYLQALRRNVKLSNPVRKTVNGKEQRLTMADHVAALSAAAGRDISPWLVSLGITWRE